MYDRDLDFNLIDEKNKVKIVFFKLSKKLLIKKYIKRRFKINLVE
jgi:hypothetical protein